MIAALAADEFERVGVAAFIRPSTMRAGWRRRARCPAVAGLASKRERHASLGVKAQPRVMGMAWSARCRVGTRTPGHLVTGRASSPACPAVIAAGHFNSCCRRACHAGHDRLYAGAGYDAVALTYCRWTLTGGAYRYVPRRSVGAWAPRRLTLGPASPQTRPSPRNRYAAAGCLL